MLDRDYEFIRGLVYTHSRINLGADKKELVSARLGKRLRATNLTTITDYCRYLQGPKASDEISHLIDVISTNHTYFFRENAHFDFLTQTVLPEFMKARLPRINIWSAACSSGEEPYTLALLLEQYFSQHSPRCPWQIEATDISNPILLKARAGVYKTEALDKISPTQLRTYFKEGTGAQAGTHQVKPSLQEHIRFRQLNLLGASLPFSEPFQIIFCRNVMIYFDRATQEELITRLTRLLMPGGYLLVGHSESLTSIKHSLQPVRPAVYRRVK
ncbi:CheR family methyltransferase [Rariglobus hedericola]|uniref:protein-glutamate O-methyltransferase n=1 Tax=Rariglobus hedericola TaxID=2597822 RepID=A0A556QPY9_9BACT|nr:protein-glutamate O-methyltransferase CheR [Rariglobus hedericola]TSJ78662.1 protein-glutamate O-methyltransferase CheR [Rariglobus hedericola]